MKSTWRPLISSPASSEPENTIASSYVVFDRRSQTNAPYAFYRFSESMLTVQSKSYSTRCVICISILQLLDKPLMEREEETLLSSSLQETTCCLQHAGVVSKLSKSLGHSIRLVRPANQHVVHVQHETGDAKEVVETGWEEMCSDRMDGPRLISRDYINLDLLRAWITDCERDHDAVCGLRESEQASLPMPLLLIDTHQHCLVTVHGHVRYFALSYVWGQSNTFVTTTANLAALSIPGALSELSTALPRTIHQAITLTEALGGRYLWIDALCIVQNHVNKPDQLNAMATLFSCASLTIIAADGTHADAGFKGLPKISAPRCATQQVMALTPQRLLLKSHQRHVWTDEELQPWSTRAWTYQEAICSRRLLYFAHDTVRWVCKKRRLSEESTSPDCLQYYASFGQRQLVSTCPSLSPSALPDVTELVALINGYNVRNLTYPQDAFNAFAGVLNRLGRKFCGGFVGGLPTFFFDLCLLWRPLQRIGPATPRLEPVQRSALPSWSWAAYNTEISFPYTWIRQADLSGPTPAMINHLRPFYTVDISYGHAQGKWNPIKHSWLHHADSVMKDGLLKNWQPRGVRHEFDARLYGTCYTSGHRKDTEFWFPIEINDEAALRGTTSFVEYPRFLSFRTTCGQYRLGTSQRSATQILTDDGQTAGILYPHDQQDAEFVTATTGLPYERPKIMLVAILGNVIPTEDFDIWQHSDSTWDRHRDQSQQQYPARHMSRGMDVYNVIWTKMVDGLHFRKGTGVVDRIVWERHITGWVDVVLA